MDEFPKRDYMLGLIEEAIRQAAQLDKTIESDLAPGFLQAQKSLVSFTDLKSQQTLVLSAARMMITRVERKTIALIIGDEPITGQQMSYLVRIRLICSELINLLSSILEWVRQSFGRPTQPETFRRSY
jgi:hypothetical protein